MTAIEALRAFRERIVYLPRDGQPGHYSVRLASVLLAFQELEATLASVIAGMEPPRAIREAFQAGYAAHPSDESTPAKSRSGWWAFDLFGSAAGDKEAEAWEAWRQTKAEAAAPVDLPQGPQGWHPIATAPKDEYQTVLGYDAKGLETRTTHWESRGWIKDSPYAMRTHIWEPTHWQALPPPPPQEPTR